MGPSETDSEGNTIANFGDNTYVQQINRNGQVFNNLDLIDIPLSVGYGWKLGKLRSDISAGVLINLYSTKAGHRFNSNLLSETLPQDANMQTIDLGYHLDIGFSYPVIGALSLEANISGFQRQINYNYYTEKQKAIGASLGLSVLF